MRIHERDLSQREFLRRVGNLLQIRGVELVRHEEGHARADAIEAFRDSLGA